jgi:hypothetical protein
MADGFRMGGAFGRDREWQDGGDAGGGRASDEAATGQAALHDQA